MIKIIKQKVQREGRTIKDAVGQCVCGCRVTLDAFTCTCTCGRDYNWNGDELAPREQWGEETGETLADIMGPLDRDND